MKKLSEPAHTLLHSLAVTRYEQGQFSKSKGLFRLLTLLTPGDARFWIGLGASLMLDGEYEEAIDAYTMASIYDEQDPRPLAYIGQCYYHQGATEPAEASLAKARALCERFGHDSFLDTIFDMEQLYGPTRT